MTMDNRMKNNVLQYTNVITNVGGGYNPATSTFTAPTEGYYVFAWSTSKFDMFYCLTSIVKNGTPILNESAFAANSHLQVGDSTSQTVVIHLEKGDRIWIKYIRDSPPFLDTGGFVDIDAFTGFRLY